MSAASTTAGDEAHVPSSGSFVVKVFYVFAALALASIGISLGGKWLGASIAAVGHSQDRTRYEILVGNNVLSVRGNMIRFEEARRDGDAERLDLYAKWPEFTGYADSDREAFNNRTPRKQIIFVAIEHRMMSRDMSGRLEPIYRKLIELPGSAGPSSLRRYDFTKESGYVNEVLIVGDRPGEAPFVARCLTGATAAESLAGCERDVHLGEQLSLTYRFPEELLPNWKALDAGVGALVSGLIRTAR